MKLQRLAVSAVCSLVFFQVLMTAHAAAGTAMPAEEVLRQAVEARGGLQAFQNLRSFQAQGRVLFYTTRGPWWDAPGVTNVWPLEIAATRSNQFRFAPTLGPASDASSVFVPPRYYVNGFDGRTAWEVTPGGPPRVLEGVLGEERREQAAFFAWCAQAGNYQSLTNLGETDFENRRCYELELVKRSGNRETHYYDVANHLLVGLVRSSVFGPSLERFVFDNYREFGGFQFPTRIGYRAEDGRYDAHLNVVEELNAIKVNNTDDSLFAMPPEPARPASSQAPWPRQQARGEIEAVLHDWVEGDRLANGMVVGLLDEGGRQVVSWGTSEYHFFLYQKGRHSFGHIVTHPKVKGNTVFPIASITKVFTRLLLLDMVQRGEMRLDDPAQQYLPDSVRLPVRNGKRITLAHLATHTSGLPMWVGASGDSLANLYTALSRHQLGRDPGAAYEYSNIGMDLLGIAIERKAGKPYRKLAAERIFQPLGMKHTSVDGCECPGAGAIESTADDMLTFASACLGLAQPGAPASLPASSEGNPPAGKDAGAPTIGLAPALAALVPLMQHQFATHRGDGGGCSSSLVVDRAHRRALVTFAGTSDGRYGYAGAALQRLILGQPIKPLTTAKIDYRLCDASAGQYLFNDNTVWSVWRSGNRLLLQETGRPRYEVFPVSETEFMNGLIGLRACFESPPFGVPPSGGLGAVPPEGGTPNGGTPNRLVLHHLERDSCAQGRKISGLVPRQGVPVQLDPRVAEDCAGQYKEPSGRAITIRRAGAQFMAEVGGERPEDFDVQDLIAESEACFVSPTAPAWLTFTFLRDDRGSVNGLILHSYYLHARYAKFAAAPPAVAAADADKFLGVWEATLASDGPAQIRATIRISKAKDAYRATLDVPSQGIGSQPFKTLDFLSKSSLSLGGSVGAERLTLQLTLNDAGTELSGVGKQGQRSLPVTFKRIPPKKRL